MSMWSKSVPIAAERPEDWRSRAKCRDYDAELWQPISSKETPAAREAKRICRACPVSGDCLTEALRSDEREGIWGGMTAEERDKLLRPKAVKRGNADYCVNGHRWTQDNTYWHASSGRKCRACAREADARKKQKAGAR